MKQDQVTIGAELWTRASGAKVRVRVLGENASATNRGSSKRRTTYRCLNLSTSREIERTAAALHPSEDFLEGGT